MKTKLIILQTIGLLFINGIFLKCSAQSSFELLISTTWHEEIISSVEDNYGNYYLSGWKTELYSPEKCGWVIKINHNGEILNEIEFCAQDSSVSLGRIFFINDTLFIFGMKGAVSSGKELIFNLALDLDLNILINSSVRIPPDFYIISSRPIINRIGEFVICGNVRPIDNTQDFDIFFYRLSRNLDSISCVIDIRDYTQVAMDCIEDTNSLQYKVFGFGYYENTHPGYDDIIYFDSLFNFIKVDSLAWHLKNQFTAVRLNDSSYLVGGKKGYWDPVRIDLGIIKLNREDEMLACNHFGKSGDTISYPAIESIGFFSNNCIYFGGTSNISNLPDFFPEENSWMILNNVNSNLALNWQVFYGGDAFYHMRGLQATNDGGCLMYAERYDENTQFEEYDVYILKVDSSGLLTSTGEGPAIPVQQLAIVPNPARDFVSIRYPDIFGYDEKEIEVFNSLGMPVFKLSAAQDLIETSVNVSALPAGLYFVVLKVEGKKVATGKLIKI